MERAGRHSDADSLLHGIVDGVNPDSAVSNGSFEFRVTYTDLDDDAPSSIQVLVDENDDSVYVLHHMSAVDGGDTIYSDGKQYSATVSLSNNGDGSLNYKFNDFLPSSYALAFSGLAFHEMLGHWWYKLRYY